MKVLAPFVVVLLIGAMVPTGLLARPAARGGGHGGGGHGGFHSGGSSGRGVGHAIGHSFGHLLGHRGKTSSSARDVEPPVAGAAFVHGKVTQLPGPRLAISSSSRGFHHRTFNDFPFGDRFFFPRRRGFGFGNCAGLGFSSRRFFFNDNFDCFGGEFSFDPFFLDAFSGSFADSLAILGKDDLGMGNVPDDSSLSPPGEEANASPSLDAATAPDKADTEGAFVFREAPLGLPAAPNQPDPRPVTLLQLRDGSMYGLTDYWVEGGRLHYTTTYGGQGSVELDRVDMEKTAELNAGRGIEFVTKPKPR